MRAAIYLRVSSKQQADGQSLDGQLADCRRFCEGRGWEIVRVYREEGRSAYGEHAKDRLQFMQMLDDAQAGLFDTIVVWAYDRFSRDSELSIVTKNWLRKHGIYVYSVTEPIDPTLEDTAPIERVFESLGQLESAKRSRRMKRAMRDRAASGLWVGHLSFGYCLGTCSSCDDTACPDRGGPDKGDGRVPIAHPVDAEGVRLAYETYAIGNHTIEDIATLLTANGYRSRAIRGRRPWNGYSVRKLLDNVLYLGLVTCRGETYPGKHPALISQNLYDRVQEVRRLHYRGAPTYSHRRRLYLLTGLLRCEGCNQRMSAQTRVGKRGKGEYSYYYCSSRRRRIPCDRSARQVYAPFLHAQVDEIISKLHLQPEWRERILELVTQNGERERVEHERRRLEEKLRRLKVQYRELDIDEETYRTLKVDIESQLSRLVIPELQEIEDAARYLETLNEVWHQATDTEKKSMLMIMLEAIYCDPTEKRITKFVPRPPFRMLFEKMSL